MTKEQEKKLLPSAKEQSPSKTSGRVKEIAAKGCFLFAAVFAIIAVVSIVVFLFMRGMPAVFKVGFFKFVFGTSWSPDPLGTDTMNGELLGSYGILPMIAGSFYAVGGALAIGGTLGFFCAVFLACFCPKKISRILKQVVNLLAGIPSIIFGFFGMRFITMGENTLLGSISPNGSGTGILAVSIILGIMILPTVTAVSTAALEAVDKSYFEGAVALGARKEQAVFRTVVPAAKSGILSSLILGVGRAIGETMAVVMVAGNNPVFADGLLSSFRTMTANIVMEMSYANEFHVSALIGTGCILFVFIFLINLAFSAISGGGKKERGRKRKEAKKSRARALALPAGFDGFSAVAAVSVPESGAGSAERGDFPHFSPSIEAAGKNRLHAPPVFPPRVTGKYVAVGLKYISLMCAVAAVGMLLWVVGFVLVMGLPHLGAPGLFGGYVWGGAPTILPSIVATLLMIVVASAISFPLGIMAAIYLNEYTKKGSKLVKVIRVAVDILGGIPSIVYGLFGMILFVQIFNFQTSILAGALTVSLMTIPTTVRAVEEALKSVPDAYREGSLALGAGKFRTIYKVVLPPAIPGILAAVILGIGKMCSESAPFMFTMGASLKPMPKKGFLSSGTTLAVAFYALIREMKYPDEAYATGCVLILLVLTLNILSTVLVGALQKKLAGGAKGKRTGRQKKREVI